VCALNLWLTLYLHGYSEILGVNFSVNAVDLTKLNGQSVTSPSRVNGAWCCARAASGGDGFRSIHSASSPARLRTYGPPLSPLHGRHRLPLRLAAPPPSAELRLQGMAPQRRQGVLHPR
jgi:hypothetical protein